MKQTWLMIRDLPKKGYTMNVILVVLTMLSVWVIVAVQLHWLPLAGHCLSEETAQAVNTVLLTLSYSYIAALMFYLLTSVLPAKQRKNKLDPIIKGKVTKISRCIHDILLEFSRDTKLGHDVHDTTNTENILRSKNWMTVVPMILQYNQVNISYLKYMKVCGDNMKSQISDLIVKYHEEMTAEQLVELETLSSSQLFHMVDFLNTIPNSRIEDGGYASLIRDFIELQKQYMKVEKVFKIS